MDCRRNFSPACNHCKQMIVSQRKNAVRNLLIILPLMLLMASCKKKDQPADGVFIRVHNAAPYVLEDATISTVSYGNVMTGFTTAYKAMPASVYAGYCWFIHDKNKTFAGYGICGTPPPPAFEPGYYTFTVEPPTDGFNAVTVTRQ